LKLGPPTKATFVEKLALQVLPTLLPSFALAKHIDGKYLSRDPKVAIAYESDRTNNLLTF
jgi:hypothetical protein